MAKVFLLCSGLGRVNRGYESFTQECFDALRDEAAIDLSLFKGYGPQAEKELALWNLPRHHPLARWLGKVCRTSGYWMEQVTFTLSLLPHIMRRQPDVIFLSDTNIGNFLWHWRRLTGRNYKLLFSNGGPMTPPFPRWDFVQQLTPTHQAEALAVGQVPERQCLLPYGIRMDPELSLPSLTQRRDLRTALHLPPDRPIVLSVGTLNKGHKRMDYLIREVAALSEPRPYLLMLGQQDEETHEVRALAEAILGDGNFDMRTVPHSEIHDYYRISDIFVLASLGEGFGRVFLEAMAHGLPCLAHDYGVTRYVLGEDGLLANFQEQGLLSDLICRALQEGYNVLVRQRRHQRSFERFSWHRLRAHYVGMICAVSAGEDYHCA